MTMIATQQTPWTPEDLLRLGDDGLYELVDGQLVEKKLSDLANETAGLVLIAIGNHTVAGRLGRVWPEQSFQCFDFDPSLVRRPDVAFIRAERLQGRRFPGNVPLVPDIAVEIVSPNDKVYELDEKLVEYRRAGIPLVWVFNPESRSVMVYRPDAGPSQLFEVDILTGESILPDFSAKVADLFPPIERT